ncbi:hypothetical protein EMCRGX_G001602 [Ephydatia muelleri]
MKTFRCMANQGDDDDGIVKHKLATTAVRDDLFRNDLGKMRHFKATLKLLPDVQPKFHRPRPVPFALKEAVERELDRLEEAGVIEKVTNCEWAAPVVVVPKKNGTVRLCGDYKVSINQALMVDQYPLPKPSDLFAAFSGGKWFTKLDLAQAYTQMHSAKS